MTPKIHRPISPFIHSLISSRSHIRISVAMKPQEAPSAEEANEVGT